MHATVLTKPRGIPGVQKPGVLPSQTAQALTPRHPPQISSQKSSPWGHAPGSFGVTHLDLKNPTSLCNPMSPGGG